MKKVLQISMGEEFGGIEKLEIEYLKGLNNKYKIDFLTPNEFTFKKYEKEINKLNGTLYNFGISRKKIKGKLIYFFRLKKFLKHNKYDIIHVNSSVFLFSFGVVFLGKICKVKKIIVHSHNTPYINTFRRVIINLFNPIYRLMIDEYLSCSKEAEYSLFTKRFVNMNKVILLKNGIDVSKFKFRKKIRDKYRKKIAIEEKIVYGNTGRFVEQKNHKLLIDIFYEIQKKEKESVLLLIGEGPLEEELKNKVNNLGIRDKVIFLGFKDDIYNYLNCMDAFIFPSLYEGLGISVIEAQTNGLTTYCSNKIPKEAIISDRFKYFDLKSSPNSIANEILKTKNTIVVREKSYLDTIKAGYEIKNTCDILDKIYEK